MARRASFFQTVREQGDAVFISGGYEFAPIGAEHGRNSAAVSNLRRAYELLGYDIFLLSPADAFVLQDTAVAPLPAWTAPLASPQLVTREVSGGLLAFVLFPDTGETDEKADEKLTEFARTLRKEGRYNLIVGVSTWGSTRENAFIESREPVFDIILGSGEGPGYGGLYLRENKVLLVRAFTKGKSVHTVTIPALPAPGAKVVWEPEISVSTAAVPLGDAIASAPEIQGIFAQ